MTQVTPEMIKAGAHAWHMRMGLAVSTSDRFIAVYTAMKVLDPEVNRMREALEIISDHQTDAACRTLEEANEHTIREMQAAAKFALQRPGERGES